jgi:hypothetical protein
MFKVLSLLCDSIAVSVWWRRYVRESKAEQKISGYADRSAGVSFEMADIDNRPSNGTGESSLFHVLCAYSFVC